MFWSDSCFGNHLLLETETNTNLKEIRYRSQFIDEVLSRSSTFSGVLVPGVLNFYERTECGHADIMWTLTWTSTQTSKSDKCSKATWPHAFILCSEFGLTFPL